MSKVAVRNKIEEDMKRFIFFNSVSSVETRKIKYRKLRLRQKLNDFFWKKEPSKNTLIFVGSHGRGTATSKHSDIDLLYVLPKTKQRRLDLRKTNAQSGLLAEVRKEIKKSYRHTSVKADGQVIIIQFSDGMKLEILPAFQSIHHGFFHANSNGGGCWEETNPIREQKYINNLDTNRQQQFTRLGVAIRCWKQTHNIKISGYLIDTLILHFLNKPRSRQNDISSFDKLLRDCFKFFAKQSRKKKYWIAKGSGHFAYKKGNFHRQAILASENSIKAIEAKDKGYKTVASSKWKLVLGTTFGRNIKKT